MLVPFHTETPHAPPLYEGDIQLLQTRVTYGSPVAAIGGILALLEV
jgi:hypothetical protein